MPRPGRNCRGQRVFWEKHRSPIGSPGRGLEEFGVLQLDCFGAPGASKARPRCRGKGPSGAAGPSRPAPSGAGRESRALIGRRRGGRAVGPMSVGPVRRWAGQRTLPGAAAPAV